MKKTLLLITNTIILLLLFSVCTTAQQMVNLEFENAHSLGTGVFDVQGTYAYQSFSNNETSGKMSDIYGGQVGVGITKNFDLKFRYEALNAPKEAGVNTLNYFSLVPKIALKKDVISFMLPLSAYTSKSFNERFTYYSIAPRLLATLPAIPNKADVSISAKGDFLIPEGGGNTIGYLGFNLGAGLSSNLKRWAIRPEASYLIHPGDEGAIWTLGVGLQVLLSK